MEQQNNTALLVMDMQAGVVAMLPDAATILNNIAKAIAKARDQKIPVIYVVVGFRQGAPELSLNNKTFAAHKELFASLNMAQFMTVHEDLKPQADEVVVNRTGRLLCRQRRGSAPRTNHQSFSASG